MGETKLVSDHISVPNRSTAINRHGRASRIHHQGIQAVYNARSCMYAAGSISIFLTKPLEYATTLTADDHRRRTRPAPIFDLSEIFVTNLRSARMNAFIAQRFYRVPDLGIVWDQTHGHRTGHGQQ